MKVLTIGGATQDIFIKHTQAEMLHRQTESEIHSFLLLEEGKKLDVEQVQYHTGGGATNSAVSLARLGFTAAACFKTGTDYQGNFIFQQLQQEGIDTSFAHQVTDSTTSVSFILSCPSGDRIALVYRGAGKTLTLHELPLEQLSVFDQVYITPLSGAITDALSTVTQEAKKHKLRVAVNPGVQQLKAGAVSLQKALSTIDILILNHYEASLLMQSLGTTRQHASTHVEHFQAPRLLASPITFQDIAFTLQQLFKIVMNKGPHIVVVTNGAEGVYVAHNNKIFFHPGLPVNVTSTLGAGDAFGSCFVGSLLHGLSIDDAIRCGVLNSSSVIQHIDAKKGLLTRQELITQLQTLDTSLLQVFAL
jgi:sugar/nucleoside kinase (ribokinase family)